MKKKSNNFSGLNDSEWKRKAEAPSTNPEDYNTKWIARGTCVLSLIVWIVLILIIL